MIHDPRRCSRKALRKRKRDVREKFEGEDEEEVRSHLLREHYYQFFTFSRSFLPLLSLHQKTFLSNPYMREFGVWVCVHVCCVCMMWKKEEKRDETCRVRRKESWEVGQLFLAEGKPLPVPEGQMWEENASSLQHLSRKKNSHTVTFEWRRVQVIVVQTRERESDSGLSGLAKGKMSNW